MATTQNKISNEQDLVSGLQQNNTETLKVLYSMYGGALLGVISRIVQHTEVAEDLLQETFVKIWNSANSYDASKGRLFTWMMNIARNLAIDKLRSKDFKNANKNQDLENNVDFINQQKKVSFNADTLGLKEMVRDLKPDLMNVINMVYFRGYTHIEAAEELNLPLGTIKTRIRTAILELRKKFN